MEIVHIPREFTNVVPKFDGDEKLLSLFVRKCEYLISCCRVENNPHQDLYIFNIITSRLIGRAAALVSERQDLDTWSDLKVAFEQHFGDPRSEECIAIELETLKINNGESYLDFCNRIQHVKSTLFAKVNLIDDVNLRQSKIIIYNNMAKNVFLYNLPEELLRIVRLKGSTTLENALSIVLEEVNFMYQYNSKNKMLRSQNSMQPKPQTMNHNPFIEKFGMKPFFTSNPQPQNNFKFGIPQSGPNTSNLQQTQPKFKFGITPNPQLGYRPQLNQGQQQFGYKPSFNQTPQQFGYRPQLNQNQQQFGYKPSFNQTQQQFGYRPQFNQGQQQFGYRPQLNQGQQQFGYRPAQRLAPQLSTDVSMRTALPTKPQGFKMNALYNLNESETDDVYENPENECYYEYNDIDSTYNVETYEANNEQYDQDSALQNDENFQINASNQPLK